ncbi:uncharacterized protein METZ01_LOCUS314052, partial [marine metagenome]
MNSVILTQVITSKNRSELVNSTECAVGQYRPLAGCSIRSYRTP